MAQIGSQQSRKALLISLLALAIPVVTTAVAPQWTGGELELLVWILPLVPAFLMSFHHGWKGASLALAAGMAVLALSQALLAWSGSVGPPTQYLLAFILVLIVVALGSGWIVASLRESLERARNEAYTDHGTGLPNRRAATMFLEKAFFAAQRGTRLSVVLFDLDHFKSINDQRGHASGDQVLKVFGEVLNKITRAMNLSARYGGEEFISVLNESEAHGASIFADRVRIAFQEASPVPGATVSAGVAEYEQGMASPDVLVAAADQALYRAKSNGRNRVEVLDRMGRRAEPPRVEPARPRPTGGGQRILVVDDDEAARRGIARGLHRIGYSVLEAESAAEAMQIIRGLSEPVDLVVTDIVMPDTGGFRLMEMICETQPNARAVYVSGYSQEEVNWAGVPGAAWGFISKPILLADLGNMVGEVLHKPLGGAASAAEVADRDVEPPASDRPQPEGLLHPVFVELDAALLDDRILVLEPAQPATAAGLGTTLRRCGFRRVAQVEDLAALNAGGSCDLLVADAADQGAADQLASRARQRRHALLLVFGEESQPSRAAWMRQGLIEGLRRPVDSSLLATTARNLLRIRRLLSQVETHRDFQDAAGAARAAELRAWGGEILRRLARAGEYRDELTADHAERVGRIAGAIASELGWNSERRSLLEEAAILHDVGKIATPDALLRKPERLTPAERLTMQEHTAAGAAILSGSRNPLLIMAEEIAFSHHERWDGGGYPTGRRGTEIPEVGRIVAVADSFDVMVHVRPYRAPLGEEEAIAELIRESGTHFDPRVVEAFLRVRSAGGLPEVLSGATVAYPDA
jgi:putative two-component system response regulator